MGGTSRLANPDVTVDNGYVVNILKRTEKGFVLSLITHYQLLL